MKLKEIARKIGIEAVYIHDYDFDIIRGYCCDLLSEVMGRAESGSIWITVHNNMNVIGVAVMIDIKAIVISEGHEVSDEMLNKAKDEGISIFKTNENSFTIAGRLYENEIR